MIRAGIIGWGPCGKKLLDTLHLELRNTEVLALATPDRDAQKYAREIGLKHVFSDYRALVALHQLDLICFCSDNGMRLIEIDEAFKSGVHVLINHPLATNVEDCESLEKTIANYPSLKSIVAFPRRFNKQLIQIKEAIDNDTLGKITRIEVANYAPISKEDIIKKSNTGIFMDLMIEDIDMIQWLTGSTFESVFVLGNAMKHTELIQYKDVDTAHALAQMENGILVNFVASRIIHKGAGFELKIVGTKGELKLDKIESNNRLISSEDNASIYLSKLDDDNEYILLLKEFIQCIAKGERPKQKVKDATNATRVAVAMTKSFLYGREISLLNEAQV